MAQLSWTSTASGDWTDAADWSGGAVPGAGDDVTIDVASVTVTVSVGLQQANSLTTTASVLDLTGGELSIGSYANLHGAYMQTGGTLSVGGTGLDFYGAATISGGVLDVTAGAFTAGGTYSQSAGSVTLAGTSSAFAGTVSLTGGTLDQLAATFTDGGPLTTNGGTLLLAGQSDAIAGAMSLQSGLIDQQSGALTAGAVGVSGGVLDFGGQTASLSGALTASGGTIALLSGSLTAGGTTTVNGGTLSIGGQIATFNGPVTLSKGMVSLNGAELLSNGSFSVSGGTLALDGAAVFTGPTSLSGGTINESGGSFAASNAFSQSGGTLLLTGQVNFSGTTNFTGGVFNLGSGELISTGAFTVSTGSTITLSGPYSSFSGLTTLAGGEIDSQAGSLVSSGGFAQSAGLLLLSGAGGVFENNLQQVGGTIRLQSGTLSLYGASNTLDGTVSGVGTLLEAGQALGLNGTTTIGSATVLKIAKISVTSGALALAQSGTPYNLSYGGYFSDSSIGTVALNGNTLTLNGRAQLSADVSGGTLVADGGGQLNGLTLDNSALLDIGSAMNLTADNDNPGLVTLRADSQIVVTAAGSLTLTGNDEINDVSSNATLTEYGLIRSIGGAATAEILASFVQGATGSLSIGLGSVDFSGASNLFEGAVSGAGTFSIGAYNNGLATSDVFGNNTAPGTGSNVALTTAGFLLTGRNTQLSFDFYNQQSNAAYTASQDPDKSAGPHYLYTGSWVQSGGVFLLGNQGQTLTLDLTGSVVLDGGVIKSSAGTIYTTGLVTLSSNPNYPSGVAIEGFTNFIVDGTVDQTAAIQLGAESSSKPTATILNGASWNLEDAASITGAYGTVDVSAGGTLSKYDGSGVSSVDGTLVNEGLLNVAASALLLDGSGTLAGTVSGGGLLELEGSGAYLLASGLALTVKQVLIDNTPFGVQSSVVALGANQSYAGVWAQHGGTLQLDGDTLTLKGTTALDGGVIAGPGTLTASGSLTLGGSPNSQLTINGQAVLDITKSAEQVTQIDVDGGAKLVVAAKATLTQDESANIIGAGTLAVSAGGTLSFDGAGYEQVSPSIVDSGSIQLDSGELSFLGSVSGTGLLAVHPGAELDLMGFVSSTNTVAMGQGAASLLIGDAPAFNAVVSGFVSGDFIEFSQLSSGYIGETFSSNDKTLTLTDSASHTFTIDFAQAQSPSQILLADGPHGYIGIYHI